VLQHLLASVFRKGGLEVADKSLHIGDLGVEVHTNLVVFTDLGNQPGKLLLDVFALGRAKEVQSLAAEAVAFLDDVGFVALAGEASGCSHAGDAAADHHSPGGDVELGLH